jgi:hypothetical protein
LRSLGPADLPNLTRAGQMPPMYYLPRSRTCRLPERRHEGNARRCQPRRQKPPPSSRSRRRVPRARSRQDRARRVQARRSHTGRRPRASTRSRRRADKHVQVEARRSSTATLASVSSARLPRPTHRPFDPRRCRQYARHFGTFTQVDVAPGQAGDSDLWAHPIDAGHLDRTRRDYSSTIVAAGPNCRTDLLEVGSRLAGPRAPGTPFLF